MSSYHEICPKCEDETITHGWSPSTCPFCKINQLERELAEARETIRHLQMENGLIKFYECEERNKELSQQRDALADALEYLVSTCEAIDCAAIMPAAMPDAYSKAIQTLAAVKGGSDE